MTNQRRLIEDAVSFEVDFALAALGEISNDVYRLVANVLERVPHA